MSIFFFLVILLGCSVTTAIKDQIPNNVDYQIHSYDDLGEFHQLLLKGARRFKFDPHFMDVHPNCASKDLESRTNSAIGGNPCLLLNHDTPNPLINSYNTSDELLSILSGEMFKSLVQPTEYVSVALCFKSAPDLCNFSSSRFLQWLKLVDDFFLKVSTLQSSGEMYQSIEFVLDGDAKPINCLENRWMPWKAVWIVDNNNFSGDIYNEAFYSNSEEHNFNRFQILNNPENVTNWAWMASQEVNYGKFSQSPYPYQLWEPDLEEDIAEYIAMYESSPEAHSPGFHFAINIDIAMFRIFRDSAITKRGYRIPKGNRQRQGLHVSLPAVSASAAEKEISVSSIQLSDSHILMATHLQISDAHGLVFYLLDVALDSDELIPQVRTLTNLSSSSHLRLFGEKDEVIHDLQLSAHNSIVTLQLLRTIMGKDGNGKEDCYEVLLVTDAGTGAVVRLCTSQKMPLSLSSSKKLQDIVQTPQLQGGRQSSVLDSRLTSLSCGYETEETTHCILQLGLASDKRSLTLQLSTLISDSMKPVFLQMLPFVPVDSTVESGQVIFSNGNIFIFVASGGHIYGTKVSLESLQGQNKDNAMASIRWVRLMAGTHVSAAIKAYQNESVLMLLTGDGYCFNSHTHNTRSAPSVCNSPATSTPFVLDYSLGLVSVWEQVLAEADAATISSNGTVISVCGLNTVNRTYFNILHGTYDLGRKPRALLFTTKSDSGKDVLQMLSVQGGFPTNATYSCGCGKPVPSDTTVVAAFAIDDWANSLLSAHST